MTYFIMCNVLKKGDYIYVMSPYSHHSFCINFPKSLAKLELFTIQFEGVVFYSF